MEERRKFVRLDTRLEISYTVTSLPADKAKRTVTKDIGGGGVCLFAERPLPSGTQLQVAMKLPGREPPVNFTAEVVWCEQYEMIGKEEQSRAVELGVRFMEIAPQDRDAIMQHVILNFKPPPAAPK